MHKTVCGKETIMKDTLFTQSGVCPSLCAIVLSLVLVVGCGCGKKQESREQAPMRDINVVMTEHTAELMAIPGVTGVAVGELDDGTPCILVLVEEETTDVVQKIPKVLEKHPVKILVSGKIVPMGGD